MIPVAGKDARPQEPPAPPRSDLRRLETKLRAGGGPEKAELQHRQGKLTARERISRLCDPGSRFLEIGLLLAFDEYQGQAPGAGVVTGIGLIDKREVVIVANDATVKAGAMWPETVKKILRVQEIAMRCRLPIIYLVDSAGAYLPYQSGVFPGQYGGARVFYYNSIMRRHLRIPQMAAVMGPCIAGGAYLPALSDFIVMVEGTSFMSLGGPSLVKAAIGQTVEAETLGGAQTHTMTSGVAHYRAANDEACLERIRRIVSALSPQTFLTPSLTARREFRRSTAEGLDSLSAVDHAQCHTRALLGGLLDEGYLEEFQAGRAPEFINGYGRIAGIPLGVIANQGRPADEAGKDPPAETVVQIGSVEKVAEFIRDCNRHGLPLLFLQDVSGSGVRDENQDWASILAGARFLEALTTATVPRIVLAVNQTSETDYFAMAAQVFDPDFIFALSAGPAQNAGADHERQMAAARAAARGFVDAVVTPDEVRPLLEVALRAALNNPGRRPGSFA